MTVNTAVPKPSGAQTPTEYVELLRRLKAWSGRSFRELEKQARSNGDNLPASTIASALKRDSLPHLDLVAALVRAVGGSTADVNEWTGARRRLAQSETGPANEPPCLLPPDRPRFVGRSAELAVASLLLQRTPATVLITGPGGAGKTAFAVRLGHTVAEAFPDGQLYIDLHGFGDDPLCPTAVLGTLLRALGVHSGSVPNDLTGLIHMYRTMLAPRRVLVVLDNAADTRQIRDLLPNGPGCGTVITSRASLAELDATRIPLGVLGADQALTLLGNMVGSARIQAEPLAAASIAARCGYLPLAVWVAGARLAARPHWTLTGMAQALADERHKLDELAVGDIAVRACVELSYRSLGGRARQALRVLGLAPGPDCAAWVLAALLDTPIREAEALVDDLIEVHLVEAATGVGGIRYRLHDLVRLFARERAEREDSRSQRQAALSRLLGACLHLTESAVARLNTDFQGITRHHRPHWTLSGTDTERLVTDPLPWLDRERHFLIAATERGLDGTATELACAVTIALTAYFQVRSHFDDWQRLQSKALTAALAIEDQRSTSKLHRALGELATIQDHYPEAVDHFEAALRTVAPDEPEYTASSLAGLAYVYRLLGRYDSALKHFHQAEELARSTNNLTCLIYVTNGIGVAELEMGKTEEAQQRFTECLRLSQITGFRPGEARAVACLGHIHRALGEFEAAAECFTQAQQISTECGDRLTAALVRCWLGTTQIQLGNFGPGRRILAECLWVFRQTGNAWGEAASLYGLAVAQLAAGRPDRARARAAAAVTLWRGISATHWLAIGLDVLADACRTAGDEPGTRRAESEARALRERMQPTVFIP